MSEALESRLSGPAEQVLPGYQRCCEGICSRSTSENIYLKHRVPD